MGALRRKTVGSLCESVKCFYHKGLRVSTLSKSQQKLTKKWNICLHLFSLRWVKTAWNNNIYFPIANAKERCYNSGVNKKKSVLEAPTEVINTRTARDLSSSICIFIITWSSDRINNFWREKQQGGEPFQLGQSPPFLGGAERVEKWNIATRTKPR